MKKTSRRRIEIRMGYGKVEEHGEHDRGTGHKREGEERLESFFGTRYALYEEESLSVGLW